MPAFEKGLNACMQQTRTIRKTPILLVSPTSRQQQLPCLEAGCVHTGAVSEHHRWQCRYNDLGGKDAATNAANRRPILGKGRGGTLSYPRRLRTGRPLDQYNDEANPVGGCSTLSSIALSGGNLPKYSSAVSESFRCSTRAKCACLFTAFVF